MQRAFLRTSDNEMLDKERDLPGPAYSSYFNNENRNNMTIFICVGGKTDERVCAVIQDTAQ